MKNGRNIINEMITQRMIERIQTTGELPWHKPWVSQDARPQNLISQKPYRGVNTFLLHMMGYAQPFFLTMKQVNGLGGHVRKGEKSMPVIFWKFMAAENKMRDSRRFLRTIIDTIPSRVWWKHDYPVDSPAPCM